MQNFYGDDIDCDKLETQLVTFKTYFNGNVTLHNVLEKVKGLVPPELSLISEIVKILQIILVIPCTNASSERSFSTLRRVKTYLRTRLCQENLNHCIIISTYKEEVMSLNIDLIVREFVLKQQSRIDYFGRV